MKAEQCLSENGSKSVKVEQCLSENRSKSVKGEYCLSKVWKKIREWK